MAQDVVLFAVEDTSTASAEAVRVAVAAFGVRLCSPDDLAVCVGTLLNEGVGPTAVLIDTQVPNAVSVARESYRLLPHVQILFLADEARQHALRPRLALAPRIGTNWSFAPLGGAGLTRALEAAARATRQRNQHRTTLDRVRLSLTAPPPADAPAYRRLVLSDRYFSTILAQASEVIVSTDGRGVIRSWNHGAERTFGYTAEQVLGRDLDVLSDENAALPELLASVGQGTSPVHRELNLRRSDGTQVTVALSIAAVRDERGELLGISVIGRDVTDRVRAEDSLREEKERLRVTLASIGDGVIATDAAGRVEFMNSVAEGLTGWRISEAAGLPLTEVFRIENEYTRNRVENPVEKVLREGVVVGLANHTILIAGDGTERPIDDSAAPIHGRDGQLLGVVLTFRDVTDARDAEHRLRESEQRFRAMTDGMPQLAWTARPDGHIFWYNRRWHEYTGTTPEQMEGWGWQSVHDPTELPKVLERWKSSLATGEPFEMVFPLKGADGVFRPFLTRVNPSKDDAGRVALWFGTNTDISEQRRLEEELVTANRRKDQFLATLAHELRNPLAPISNALQVWPLVEKNPAEAERVRDMMSRQVQQMVRLIDDLLDVSRITRGRIELRKDRLDLATVIEGAIEAVRPFVESCKHELVVVLPTKPVIMQGDVGRLLQVFGNIIHNAAKYAGRNGHIWVTAKQEGGQAVVSVRDDGPGIPAEMLTGIFEMFAQVDQTLDRAHGGLGIGLTLVKTLVELHEGTVEAISEGPGRGSEFVVRLPGTASVDEPEVRRAGFAFNRSTPMPRHRILVVDDVKPSANTLAMMLNGLGQETAVAYDGTAALAAVRDLRPDVVFLDVAMPGMDGYEVAKRVRQMEGFRPVLVALTGYGQEEDRRRAFEAGFDHHLVKPTSVDALRSLLLTVPSSAE